MSDTPETDGECFIHEGDYVAEGHVPASFARKLERDRDAANRKLEKLYQALNFRFDQSEKTFEIVLSDAKLLRPEMVKARHRASEVESSIDYWLVDNEILNKSGTLNEVWKKLKECERERDEARKERDAYERYWHEAQKNRDTWIDCLQEVKTERADLRAELYRANNDNAILAGRLTACELERDSLGAELERLKADKARLDFCDTIIDLEKGGYALHFPVKESTTIRGAIDAAMKGAE